MHLVWKNPIQPDNPIQVVKILRQGDTRIYRVNGHAALWLVWDNRNNQTKEKN